MPATKDKKKVKGKEKVNKPKPIKKREDVLFNDIELPSESNKDINIKEIEKIFAEKYKEKLSAIEIEYEEKIEELQSQVEEKEKTLTELNTQIRSENIDKSLNNMLSKHKPLNAEVVKSFIKSNYTIDLDDKKELVIKKGDEAVKTDEFLESFTKDNAYLFEKQTKEGVTVSNVENGGNVNNSNEANSEEVDPVKFYGAMFD